MFWLFGTLVMKMISVYQLIVIASVVTKLLELNPKNFLVRLVARMAEPVIKLVRPLARMIPGPMDWSPALAILGLELVSRTIHFLFR